jgi:glyoxylase-like metal-dependent hydrolase (beta-lactamase superfamily II)
MPEFTQKPPVELFPGVWNMTPGMANSYLIIGKENCLQIDTGIGLPDFIGEIRKITDKPVSLATTHAHGDHTGSHKEFSEFYIHEKDLKFLDDELKGKAKTYDFSEPGKPFRFDDDHYAIFVELPGHTPGSVGVLDMTKRLFFTGDMVCNGSIFMIEGQCDFDDFIASMETIEAFSEAFDWIVTCHGEPNKLPVSHLKKQIAAAKAFKAGKLPERDGMRGASPMPGKVFADNDGIGFFRPQR